MLLDTIIARVTPPGSAIRGIIRVSGQCAVAVVKTIVKLPDACTWEQRSKCVDAQIVLPSMPPPQAGIPAKLLFWKEGHSYTGDETVEIHTIGSPVLLDAIMTALLAAPDAVRLAKPGEFTLRAFLSGRLDLTQAEAVLGVIDADNLADLKTALHQLAGNVFAPLTAVRILLFETLAQIEASLDFAADEEATEIPAVSARELRQTLTDANHQIEQIRRRIALRGIAEGKPKIILAGQPNAGKSTLFNKLVQKDVALVSPHAGTTRDYLEAEIDWDGVPVVLIDTAGIGGEPWNVLDESAQEKTLELLNQADVIIYCFEETADGGQQTTADLAGTPAATKTVLFQTKTPNESLESLVKEVGTLLRNQPEYGMLPNTALRCRESLLSAAESLARAMELTDLSLIALELRHAVNHLGLIDGAVHTEDILDNIFSRFCIGK